MATLPLSEVKARLSEIAEEVAATHERIQITKNGRDHVVLLAAEDLESIEATLELLSDERRAELRVVGQPHRVGAPLRGPFAGQWRARRGEYRVRYRIDDTSTIVYVLDIDHRRDAYRS